MRYDYIAKNQGMQMHMHKEYQKQWKRRFRYIKHTNQLSFKTNCQTVSLKNASG